MQPPTVPMPPAYASLRLRALAFAADSLLIAVYLAEKQVDVLPAVGAGDNRYELTLIDAGVIVEVSAKYDLQADPPALPDKDGKYPVAVPGTTVAW